MLTGKRINIVLGENFLCSALRGREWILFGIYALCRKESV